ncbi:ribosome maturation factor RimM [uncultured Sharpea sp.]|uniref:ribosome maturation factor RimM n=1 Tax=uncultured Sharpea sp. TaxID=1112738 RepID=UPI0013DB2F51|nr:ribosome maturation factor RimM [uncultured Sharpea sp.]
MEKVRVGKIVNTFGIRGELKVDAYTDFPDERFQVGNSLFVRFHNEDVELEISRHRVHKGYDLITFKDLENINFVEQYKGCFLYAYRDESLLDEDEHYVSDYIGCMVYNYGKEIGKVVDLKDNTYQDIFVVDYNGKQVLIPKVDAFVKNVDIDQKRIDVELIAGFIDEN